MEPTAMSRFFVIFLVLLLSEGCSNTLSSPASAITSQSNPTYELSPAKEIIVTYGRYDKPFTKLGPVEFTLTTPATPDDNYELWDQAINFLKKDALRKFGDKVDAIFNVEIVENTEENNDGQYNIVHAKGVAVSFSPGSRPTIKHRAKSKAKSPSKSASNKAKPSPPKKAPEKPQPQEEIGITPSELLK
jgi:hypothetical protein